MFLFCNLRQSRNSSIHPIFCTNIPSPGLLHSIKPCSQYNHTTASSVLSATKTVYQPSASSRTLVTTTVHHMSLSATKSFADVLAANGKHDSTTKLIMSTSQLGWVSLPRMVLSWRGLSPCLPRPTNTSRVSALNHCSKKSHSIICFLVLLLPLSHTVLPASCV
jgi:hypothetical protein